MSSGNRSVRCKVCGDVTAAKRPRLADAELLEMYEEVEPR